MKKTSEQINKDEMILVTIAIPKNTIELNVGVGLLDEENYKIYRANQKYTIGEIYDILSSSDETYEIEALANYEVEK